ncbi:AAA family ATPase [Desulfuromonas thiophila]|jgi:MoxR-like ATPase|uniref:MoxR-like ATPase n=1 Tax=Desulfuromonas thiophila TaxID=57664 RepID=A0A1G6WUA6_9BACT|nr:MoxR family ATPase [Desulfuromonas thiophila]MCK9172789.1 MoxR family ATPase [Desulfuromonas thiophila]MDD3801966.1 MoxR family ATPase [Desulfuromonas thiophila]SDD68767.1 MoxR-like ATPase [Desulfuromonas thiophila]
MDSVQHRFVALSQSLQERIIGQPRLVERLLIALLADGHLLVEGAPGLAKTRAIRLLGAAVQGRFHRIQFTPDLLPADLTGSDVFRPQDGSFVFQPGPLFNNLILADEINRAPAKVQAALLEAMAERQISVGQTSYRLADPFLVMATQNPIEQEGTYPLPEAQLDRFLLHVVIDYPDAAAERRILQLARQEAASATALPVGKVLAPLQAEELRQARGQVLQVHLAEALEEYLVQLVLATRDPAPWGEDLASAIDYGASPRATIALDRCSRARAWLAGRDFVTPDDIQSLAPDVLRHRILLRYEAEARGLRPDALIARLLERLPVP